MTIVQITPGAGGMYCGNCFRDNALVAALNRKGHRATMIPLYLPLKLDELDQSQGMPIFFSGINVYLEQIFPLFRRSPQWLHDLMASSWLLKRAAGMTARTNPRQLGSLTHSMLQGETGNQAREVEELAAWLRQQPGCDVICLSNALLIGMARRLRSEARAPVVCMLQGEDSFLDALPEPWRKRCWDTLSERMREADLLVAPSHYYACEMSRRLNLPEERIKVVHNGISLQGYQPPTQWPDPPVLGYFARMCREKGVDRLVGAYLKLRNRNKIPGLRLRIGGGLGPSDTPLVNSLKDRLESAGYGSDVEFHPNLSRQEKANFLSSLSILSVPALYGEAFGLYVLEAWASGTPVVAPDHAAFPELIRSSGGGRLFDPEDPDDLPKVLEELLLQPELAHQLGKAGRQSVEQGFSVDHMADNFLRILQSLKSSCHGLRL